MGPTVKLPVWGGGVIFSCPPFQASILIPLDGVSP